MMRWKAMTGGAMIAAMVSVGGCTSTCIATPDKLAALHRGMSRADAVSLMGCRGAPVLPVNPGDDVTSLEWQGPGLTAVTTQLDFQNDRLLYYVTRPMGGL